MSLGTRVKDRAVSVNVTSSFDTKPSSVAHAVSKWSREFFAFLFIFVTLTRVLMSKCSDGTFITYSTTTRLAAPCSTLAIFTLLSLASLVSYVQHGELNFYPVGWFRGLLRAIHASQIHWMFLICVTSSFSEDCSLKIGNGLPVQEMAHSYGVFLYSSTVMVVDFFLSYNRGIDFLSDFELGFKYWFYGANGAAFFFLCYASLFVTSEGYGSELAALFEYISLTTMIIYFFGAHILLWRSQI
jgi:hypothetical protein